MTSRPWMIALAASATINVFLIGGLAGVAYSRLTSPPAAVAPAGMTTGTPVTARPPVVPPPSVVPSATPPPADIETGVEAPRPSHRPAPHAVAPPADPPPTPATAPPMDPAAGLAQPARPPLISAGDGLSPDSRRAFRRALNEANKKNKPLTQQARAERQAALSALGAPGYDAAEVTRRLSAARSLDQEARGNVEAALAAFTATLSPQERSNLADGLARVYAPLVARRAAMAGPN